MQQQEYIAQSTTEVNAKADEVWAALTNPSIISTYMMGTDVQSSWKTGSKIVWRGEWKGKKFKDHGEVLDAMPGKYLKYTHVTGSSLERDPKNQHTVTVELDEHGDQTTITLTQDNNSDEKMRLESEKNWQGMLEGLKKFVEAHHEV